MPCVCWGWVAREQGPGLQPASGALEITAALSGTGLGRGEGVRGCDFFIFEAPSMGENKRQGGIPLCSYSVSTDCPAAAPLLRAAARAGQIAPKASPSEGAVGFVPRLQLRIHLTN